APNGRVLVVEANNGAVTERTTAGTPLARHQVLQQPLSIDLLPDGGYVVVCRNGVHEFDKDWGQRWFHQRPNYDIMAGRRLPTGETVVLTNAYQNPGQQRLPNCFRIDAKGQDAKKNLTFDWIQQLQSMDAVGKDHVL